MSNKLFDAFDISNIASAIRSKNGSSDTYKVSQMAQAILDIPSGGGGEWELQFFNYLTLDHNSECRVFGELTASYTYYLKVNTLSAVQGGTHPILRTELSDWRYWLSVNISGLRYYFGNNNGGSVGGDSVVWEDLLGEHEFTYVPDRDPSTGYTLDTGTIKIDNGATANTYVYSNVSNSNVKYFILGCLGSSENYNGQIERFYIQHYYGQLLYDYVPCGILHNGVLVNSGLYDVINNKYFASDGVATNTKAT